MTRLSIDMPSSAGPLIADDWIVTRAGGRYIVEAVRPVRWRANGTTCELCRHVVTRWGGDRHEIAEAHADPRRRPHAPDPLARPAALTAIRSSDCRVGGLCRHINLGRAVPGAPGTAPIRGMDTELTSCLGGADVEHIGPARRLASWISGHSSPASDHARAVDVRWANATGPVPTVDGLVRFANGGPILGRPMTSAIDLNRLGVQLQVDLGRRYHDAAGGEH